MSATYSPLNPSNSAVNPPIPISVPTAALFPCFFLRPSPSLPFSLSYLLRDFDLRLLRSPPESDVSESSSYLSSLGIG